MAFQEYFSIVAFFVFLRETLEASVIIAVLLQCMNRTCPRLKKPVWLGAAAGIAASIVAGGIFAAVYYLAQAKLFQGNGKLIFQGCISYLACILITYLGFAMMRFSNMERKYMRKLDTAAAKALEKGRAGGADGDSPHRSHAWSVFILAATAVLREGIESIIFLAGVGSNTSFRALPLACLAGLVVGLAVGFVIYYSGRAIKDLKLFFIISTIVLFFIAAGQVSLGTQLLSKAGAFGYYSPWVDELSWQHRPVIDLSGCCSDDFATGNQFFVLARAVVGYQARPSVLIILFYCVYWVAVIVAVTLKWRNGSLFDADYKRKRTLLRLSRRAQAARRKLTRCERRVAGLEGKVAAGGPAAAGAQAQLADARAAAAAAAAALAAADAARDAEAARLDEEDERVAASGGLGRGAGGEQGLPTVQHGGDDSASSDAGSGGSPAAAAMIVSDVEAPKDVELVPPNGGGGSGKGQAGGGKGWLSKLRRQQQ